MQGLSSKTQTLIFTTQTLGLELIRHRLRSGYLADLIVNTPHTKKWRRKA